jgi:FAD/FMN-containing dehydrogenase
LHSENCPKAGQLFLEGHLVDLNLFRDRLGPKGFTTDDEALAPWLTDWRRLYTGKACALLSPATTEEVQFIVSKARETGLSLVPQGGNTSMVGGATPDANGRSAILSLRRMNAIRKLDVEGLQAVAEAGVILSNLHEATDAVGTRFPLSLGAKGSATIGGLVSTNAGGTQVLRFGNMRQLVLGLEAVMPDGGLFQGLVPLKKDNRGYDLTQLLIGAEGSLGVVTAANLRLVPAIASSAVAWVSVASPSKALELLRWLEAETGDAVESFELVPGDALEMVLKHIAGTRNPLQGRHDWHVLIEFVAPEDAVGRLSSFLAHAIEGGLATDAVLAANVAQAKAFWRIRESISEAERSEGPLASHDISVAVADMPAFIESTANVIEAEFPDSAVTSYGHLGDGNVHLHVRARPGVDGVRWRSATAKAATSRVYDLVVAAGGSISAEHGIGQMKRDELLRLSDPVRINMLRAIKTALDPAGIMNPGKLVPLAPARAGS